MQTNSERNALPRRGPTLARMAFVTDRAMEFFTECELTTQMGYGRKLWPLALAKELIDNALDACEIGNGAPEISIKLEADAITVTDNGGGIPPEVIERSLDYKVRISDKKHYVSPTRGQLGNALKCVWAAPFVANGTHSGLVEVTTRGLHHQIEVSLDRIRQVPVIGHNAEEVSVKNGTSVKIHWSEIASCDISGFGTFYQMTPLAIALRHLVTSYAAFNPHATFHFGDLHLEASDPKWQKWRTDQPPSAHWYRAADLRNLIAAHIASGDRPIRDFLADFAGLAGTQIRKTTIAAAGIIETRLSELVTDRDLDMDKVGRLLAAMRTHSKPIKPERLGVIGRAHFEKTVEAAGGKNFRYFKQAAFDEEQLPFVIEIAFGIREEAQVRMIGVNWSPVFKIPSGHIAEALSECQLQFGDAVTLFIHMAQARFAFSDHGKGALAE